MSEFKQGWKPLMAAILGTGCGLIGITNYTQSLFVGPVSQEFGWGRGQFYMAFTIMMLAGLITAPIVGSLADKKGARLVGMVGLVGHSIGYFLISLNPGSLVLWYFSFATLAVFAAGSLPITWTSVVNKWFYKNRGLAIGMTMSGTGLIAIAAPPYVAYLISHFGWRTGYGLLGLTALAISLPAAYLLFKEPALGAKSFAQPIAAWGLTRRDAMKTYKFWALGIALALTTLAIVGCISNFVPILNSKGIPTTQAAGIASVLGLTVVAGRLMVGFLLDRFWAPGVAAVFLVFPTIAVLVLANLTISPSVAIAAAILLGLAAGAELDLLAFLTSKYFGVKHYGAVFGGIFAFFTVASGVAPPIFGESFDISRSYDSILIVAAVLLVVGIGLFLSLGKPPQPLQQGTRPTDLEKLIRPKQTKLETSKLI